MFAKLWFGIVVISLTVAIAGPTTTHSQQPVVPPAPKEPDLPPPPAPTAVAATVNGQPIPEMAVYRGLLREDPKRWPMVRKDVVNYLVDNMLVDQYLTQLKIPVEAKELDERVGQIKNEAKKSGMEFPTLLKRLHLTEEDLRRELTGALRWDKF